MSRLFEFIALFRSNIKENSFHTASELVEEQEARHGYKLAHLTVKNCVNTVSPSESPLFYGNLEVYEGGEASRKMEVSKNTDAFYFAGIGDNGSVGVLVDRECVGGRICILTSLGGGEVESRYCKIQGKITSKQLRHVFTRLENSKPKAIELKNDDNLRDLLDSFLPDKKRLTKPYSGRAKGARR
jgi:hypothetical protein